MPGTIGQQQKLILEIRAGAGGGEAALFARDLSQMYAAFCQKRGWRLIALDESPSTSGGYKEVIFAVEGEGAYGALRAEAGVHRVQRIPATEKAGRIHTSTASVAVLPVAEASEVAVRPSDIKMEFFRSSGPGGQNVNKVETAVRIHHLPSGVVVTSQGSRSQQKNREHALLLLRSRLAAAQRSAEEGKLAAERRGQIGSAERAEKIRTYNFPQDRITDHRLKKSWHHMENILAGNLDPIVEAFAGQSS